MVMQVGKNKAVMMVMMVIMNASTAIYIDTVKLWWLEGGSVTGGISAPCKGEAQWAMKFPSATRGAEAC